MIISMIILGLSLKLKKKKNKFFSYLAKQTTNQLKILCKLVCKFSDYSQTNSVFFLFSFINQAKTHKYEFEHFIYEKKQGFDCINPN